MKERQELVKSGHQDLSKRSRAKLLGLFDTSWGIESKWNKG